MTLILSYVEIKLISIWHVTWFTKSFTKWAFEGVWYLNSWEITNEHSVIFLLFHHKICRCKVPAWYWGICNVWKSWSSEHCIWFCIIWSVAYVITSENMNLVMNIWMCFSNISYPGTILAFLLFIRDGVWIIYDVQMLSLMIGCL